MEAKNSLIGPTARYADFAVRNLDTLHIALLAAKALTSMIYSLALHGNGDSLDFDSQLAILLRALPRGQPLKPIPRLTMHRRQALIGVYNAVKCGHSAHR